MKFVVTGGAGFIGSHLAEYLVKEQHSVTVIDNLHSGKTEKLRGCKDETDFIKVDVLDYKKLKNVLKNVDGVFHEAALTVVQDSFKKEKEYYDVNVIGTKNILDLAKEYGFKVVFASSSSVYGNPKSTPISEDFERRPLNPYGHTKLEAEYLAEKYSKLGIDVIGLRYFNVYGLRQNPAYAGVISKFLENISNHKPPVIFGDGLQIRDFVFVGDVAKANLKAMKSKISHSFINVGTGVGISINKLARMIIDLSGLNLSAIYREPMPGDVRESQADISRAKKLLDWKPETNLEDWLNIVIPTKEKKVTMN